MIFSKRISFLIAVFILHAIHTKAQDKPIGYWQSHLPYNSAIGIAAGGTNLFTICNETFFTHDPIKEIGLQTYSKVDGMSDVGMQCVGYDVTTSTTVLVYANGNIDLFKNNTFYNIPDLKIKTVAGNKAVYNVYTENGIAYLSTSLGILLVDLANYNIAETYQFIQNSLVIPVTNFIGAGSYFYAATPNGLYRADKNNPELQNFQVWQRIDSTHVFTTMAVVNNVLFLSDNKSIYTFVNDSFTQIYTSQISIQHIDEGYNCLLVCELNPQIFRGDLKAINLNYQVTDSFACVDPLQALQLQDSSIWVADAFNGLTECIHAQVPSYYIPDGPYNVNSFDIYAYNKNVWVAHGGYTDSYFPHDWGYGMSNFSNEQWSVYHQYQYGPFSDSIFDLIRVVKDQSNGTLYAASFQNGLFVLEPNGGYQILEQNSIFDTSISIFGSGQRQLGGIALDKSHNLWVSSIYAKHQLCVKTADSIWYKFLIPNLVVGVPDGGPIAVDDNGQVWVACLGGGGVYVFNSNGTISDPTDDTSYHLTSGVGFGNLPSNNVFCLAKDYNNNIWIGTDNGIGIVSNCNPSTASSGTQSAPCDAVIPIVQYDQFAGYLFAGDNVKSIAVDGANRKWVGTDNGVWLLSPDASQIIYRFTSDNSPLPSNVIEKIAIDDVTGDVYIGTDNGLVSYHSTATLGGTSNQNVVVFPDPVPTGYTGTIAIKGLVANADVRITDIDGQLVYRTTALGGQAVWNGLDYKGHRPQTGVYLIFVSSSDGSQTYTGKIAFMN